MTDSSLRGKMIGILVTGSAIAALISAAGFSWWDMQRFSKRTGDELSAVSSIVADQVGPALMLTDAKAANEILVSLHTDNRIQDAILYDGNGSCFAAFERDRTWCVPRPQDGIRREAGAFIIAREVTVGTERVGTLLLTARIPSIWATLRQYIPGAILILVLSLAIAGVLAVVLQSRVTDPILGIAKMAQRIAVTHGFGERVAVQSADEVGVLASSFNTMLDEIERRDQELADQRQRLEQEVAERSRVNVQLRQAKDKAESAARLKTEFLANMSHEIRTPLNGISGMLSLVLDRCSDNEDRDQLQVAQSAAKSLTAILNDILDLSKMEAGKLSIESVQFELSSMLGECLQIFAVPVREKGLRLGLGMAPGCPAWVRGDPIRLRQILINLLGNAVKFTLDGEVQLGVAPGQPGTLRFEVRDTGIGIPRDKLESVFEAFTQADGSHTRRFGGTGLGLTITRRLVSLMGGALWAESEPGQGSSFFVDLPLAACPECGKASEPALQPTFQHDRPALHVLVAEDNVVNQRVACGMLKRQGWTVTVANNGEQAYACFRREHFDLILMDVQMPEVDGLEATALIRSEERRRNLPRTPIIASTAHAEQAQQEQCLAQGMDAVVTKPMDLATLLTAIHAVLDSLPVAVH